ncbi:PilN domain-containing protein [Pelomonas sp. APW6]|uniref:PilN domain-containing protein n=1 Tax=Roseateles subflavus TaxID=3053353 RepID=A0ABT7LP35_9BURK|nr:PilN domain-containing protein [Pelomonas sp. APW6]MDL5034529.1 PilN domain-containing protein [Pelomonas sp. APW6]
MAQQINLLTPILLKPRRHFTAVAMLQALGLILIGSLALAAWIGSRADQRRAEFISRSAAQKSQQEALTRTLAALPGASDLKATEAQIALLKQQQQSQSALLQSLTHGQRPAGERHSDLLALLASSVPATVWLQGLRWQAGQLELSGGTLDPSALRGWVSRLQTQALLQRVVLAEVKLELVSAGSAGADAGLAGRLQLPAGAAAAGQPVWAFQVRGVAPVLPLTPAASAALAAAAPVQVATMQSGGQP